MVKGHVYLQELNCQRARQKSRECGRHVETIVTIMDFDGLELMAGKRAMPSFKTIYDVDGNHYPERMGLMFALNTPRVFPNYLESVQKFPRSRHSWKDLNSEKRRRSSVTSTIH